MKSIMEEASSIMEAIQKGWERAGKPQEFSVKVFEDAQTSFFGMRTVKSAKVALFFKEGTPSIEQAVAKPVKTVKYQPEEQARQEQARPSHQKPRKQERPLHHKEVKQREQRPLPESKPEHRAGLEQAPREKVTLEQPRERQDKQEKPVQRSEWTPEMTDWVSNWVTQTLQHAGHSEIIFSTEISKNLLRIDFSSPFVSDIKQERLLFSTFAHLIMSSLRNKFKGDLKHLKVVLNSK